MGATNGDFQLGFECLCKMGFSPAHSIGRGLEGAGGPGKHPGEEEKREILTAGDKERKRSGEKAGQ